MSKLDYKTIRNRFSINLYPSNIILVHIVRLENIFKFAPPRSALAPKNVQANISYA